MDETDDGSMMLGGDVEAEIKEMIGLFDAPSFARRGAELEHALRRLGERCRQARSERLDMVRLRLRQWAGAATGPQAELAVFRAPIGPLWPLSDAPAPVWAAAPAPARRHSAIARDLVHAVVRFNQRWSAFCAELNLDPVNTAIDHYNQYYVLEKECVMGSARLAARFFTPEPRLDREWLLREHPLLPIPELAR